MITTKKELNEWLKYEKARYGLRGGRLITCMKYLYGSEIATIWHFQSKRQIKQWIPIHQ